VTNSLVGIACEHIEVSASTSCVDPFALCIDEQVVRTRANFRTIYEITVFHREHAKHCGITKSGENSPGRSVDRHRRISAGDSEWSAAKVNLPVASGGWIERERQS